MEPDANLADIGLEDGSVTVISDYSTEGAVPAPATNSPVAATPAPSPAPVDPVVITGAPTIGILPPAPDPLPPPPPPPAPVSPPPPPPDTDAYTYTGDDAYTDDGYGAYYDDTPLPDAPLQVFSEPVTEVIGATTEEYIEQQSTTQTITTQAAAVITSAPVPAPAPGVITAAPSPGVVITAAPVETSTETSPIIAGGVLTDHTAVNTVEGDELVLAAVSAPVVIPEAGDRVIPPINCAGVTGEDCCLIIKLSVPDSDANGKAIQCILTYAEDTAKKTYWSDLRGKKVHIKGNHNGYVMQNPKVTGTWPAGKEGAEFEQWLLQAGAPPLALQAEYQNNV